MRLCIVDYVDIYSKGTANAMRFWPPDGQGLLKDPMSIPINYNLMVINVIFLFTLLTLEFTNKQCKIDLITTTQRYYIGKCMQIFHRSIVKHTVIPVCSERIFHPNTKQITLKYYY